MERMVRLSREAFDAAVFDLDGVLTQTARVHALAWKRMFDEFLGEEAGEGETFEPFDPEADYLAHVDGKPRVDGVASFLSSRGISLPPGVPNDPPRAETLWGLGNRKNGIFHRLLQERGVQVFDGARELLRGLRSRGYLTAVVSSSRNCAAVLDAAGMQNLFDARVDGTDLERFGLRGKPAPDMFREAARRLEVAPSRAAMFEDALVGVEAGRAAGFGLVVGVSRAVRPEQLRQAGADAVISELADICLEAAGPSGQGASQRELPSPLQDMEVFTAEARNPVLFLDFDGTLAPIADDPDAVYLSDPMRAVLDSLAHPTTVAVVSGRDLDDVRKRVGLENIYYAGSHGFDIAGPEGTRVQFEQGGEFSGQLEETERFLREATATISGARVERKRFSVALHYRLVPEQEVAEVRRIADEALGRAAGLRQRTGKKVFEFQPDIAWDKGRAVRWLLEALRLDVEHVLPVYVGDDETDEDAFLALEQDGIGIAVQERPSATAARYRLRDPEEVRAFLEALQGRLAATIAR